MKNVEQDLSESFQAPAVWTLVYAPLCSACENCLIRRTDDKKPVFSCKLRESIPDEYLTYKRYDCVWYTPNTHSPAYECVCRNRLEFFKQNEIL